MEETTGLVVGLIVVGLIAAWVYSDAVARGRTKGDATLWAILTFAFCILALPAWLLIRPRRPVEVQVLPPSVLCRECGKYYSGNPSFCPNCGKPVSVPGH